MTLERRDPLRNLLSLQERMNRLFEETVHGGLENEPLMSGMWTPPVDIFESGDDIVLVAELPGMELKDIDIQVSDNSLTIRGERKMEKAEKEDCYHRVERVYGTFSRSFTLPGTVDQDNISASYNKGVLEIKMPKTIKSKPKQIQIEVKD